jgi:hypothetical protein
VFRVMTASGDAALDDFLSRFEARLIPGGPLRAGQESARDFTTH